MIEKKVITHGKSFFTSVPMIYDLFIDDSLAIFVFDLKNKFSGGIHYKPKLNLSESVIKLLKMFKDKGSRPEDLKINIVSNVRRYNEMANDLIQRFNIATKTSHLNSKGAHLLVDTSRNCVFLEKKRNLKKDEEIKVLIVDDSPSMRKVIKSMLIEDPKITIIGEAADPFEADDIIEKVLPDVITLDINMPRMDGVTYLKKYMAFRPIPTIMVTSLCVDDSHHILDSLEYGAFDYVEKPSFQLMHEHGEELRRKVFSAYYSKAVKKKKFVKKCRMDNLSEHILNNNIIAVGASTGGTEAIKKLLLGFPKNIPPVLIVQHIPKHFSAAFANRLNEICPFVVKEAEEGEEILPNKVLIAPGGQHMKVVNKGRKLKIKLTQDPPVNRFRPSVDYMFNSLADVCVSRKISGILLTGMGNDGAQGLLNLKSAGSYTIAQDESSSSVFGMPKAAIEINGQCDILALEEIAESLFKKTISY